MLRAFIAIHIPLEVRQAIRRSVAVLQKTVDRSIVRWVELENIHLTLKFLGDVAPSNLQLLEQMLGSEAARHPCFEMQVGSLGVFPNTRHPRVIWVGLDAPAGLIALQRGVEAAMGRLGYAPENRAFSPHLTIGRVQDHVTTDGLGRLRTALEDTAVGPLGCVSVEGIYLMKSDLQPGGSVYSTLYEAPLARI